MAGTEHTLLILFIILFVGLVIPELFRKFQVPFVSTVIVLGAILGPFGLDWIQTNEIVDFFGFLGFTFLMLLAGLEARPYDIEHSVRSITLMSTINAIIPFVFGMSTALWFGYSWTTSILVGIIFISSSVAIIIPVLKNVKISTHAKDLFVSSVVVQDAISLVLLAIVFHRFAPIVDLSLPVYIVVLLLAFVALKMVLPKLGHYFIKRRRIFKDAEHEARLRFIIVVLMAVLALFSLLGVHPILAAFLVGMLLADQLSSKEIFGKINTLGYGLFVPIFFFVVGMEMDLTIFRKINFQNLIIIVLPIGLIISKILSGYLAARLSKMHKRDAGIFGVVTITQLTTTLAAAYAANAIGLLDNTLLTAMILVCVLTTLLVPFIVRFGFSDEIEEPKK